jgi:hypothetical protein
MRAVFLFATVLIAASTATAAADVPFGVSVQISTKSLATALRQCLRVRTDSTFFDSAEDAVRATGAAVDSAPCTVLGAQATTFPGAELTHHWMLTSRRPSVIAGQIRSWISDKCLSACPSTGMLTLQRCDVTDANQMWTVGDSGELTVAAGGRGARCLSQPTHADGPIVAHDCTAANASAAIRWQFEENALVVFPPLPHRLMASAKYTVTITAGSSSPTQPYVYMTVPQFNKSANQFGKTLSYTSFSFDNTVYPNGIDVEVETASPYTKCVIKPSALNIDCNTIDSRHIKFHVPHNMMKISVEFDPASSSDESRATNVVTDALMVFADPTETAPDPNAPGVKYYDKGFQKISCVRLESNTQVYLAGGAFLIGAFETAPGTNNVAISGRGIVSLDDTRNEENHGCPPLVKPSMVDHEALRRHALLTVGEEDKDIDAALSASQLSDEAVSDLVGRTVGKPPGLIMFCGGSGMSVDGILAVATPECVGGHIGGNIYWDGCNVNPAPGQGMRVTNVKVMGWSMGADGIFVGRQGYVADSFIRVNDDNHPDFQSNQLWERNTLWQLANGWPFMIQWNTRDSFDPLDGAENVTVRDSVIVHVEQISKDAYGGNYRSVFGAWQGEPKPNTIRDFVFSNIAIEGGIWVALIMMYVHPGPFSYKPWDCCYSGALSGFQFNDIVVDQWPNRNSWLRGNKTHDGLISGIAFNGVSISGKHILSAQGMNMSVDTDSVSNVSFT